MADLQNITFTAAAAQNVQRIRVRFEYSEDSGKTWTAFSYVIPDDMFDIRPDDRERIAIDLIRAIAIGKGHMTEDGVIVR